MGPITPEKFLEESSATGSADVFASLVEAWQLRRSSAPGRSIRSTD